jgi:hypothetical protein
MKDKDKKSTAARPKWIHGTNQGRVEVPVRGPGETSSGSGADKGKARVAMGVPVSLACEQDEHEGGYKG